MQLNELERDEQSGNTEHIPIPSLYHTNTDSKLITPLTCRTCIDFESIVRNKSGCKLSSENKKIRDETSNCWLGSIEIKMSTRQERAERRMARKDENSIGVENVPAKKRSVKKTGVAAVHKNGALKPLPLLMNKIGPPVADDLVRARLEIGSNIRENVGIATASNLPVNHQLKTSTQSSAICHGIDANARENVRIKTEPIPRMSLYSQLKELGERGGFITNTEDFECVICFTMIEIGDGVRLQECLHQFCYDCLKNAIMLSDEAEVPCPFGDGASKCEAPLLESEIRAILSANEYDNYLKRSLRIAEGTIQNTIHCKLADCDGWCICEDNVNQFACPKCKSVNCVSCQVSVAILHAHHR